MNDILKQRLVGALVIIAVSAFFWPMVFVGPEREPLDRTSQVPGIPSLKQMQLDAPVPLQGIAPAPELVPESEDSEAEGLDDSTGISVPPAGVEDAAEQPSAAAEQTEGLDADGIPIAWTLQVVSVSKQEKAEELMQQLVGMGYKAYFKAVSHGGGTLYRVYVGPKFGRDKMTEAKRLIDKEFRVNSIVTRYLP